MQIQIRPFTQDENCAKRAGLRTSFAAAALMLLLSVCGAAFAQSPALGTTRIAGQTPRPVLDGTAMRVEHYDPAKMLRLAITLTPPHPVEEAQFLEDVQDKNSPLFHQFLSAEEWNTRFGPSEQDERTVAEWAKSQGLTITYRYAHRLAVG